MFFKIMGNRVDDSFDMENGLGRGLEFVDTGKWKKKFLDLGEWAEAMGKVFSFLLFGRSQNLNSNIF